MHNPVVIEGILAGIGYVLSAVVVIALLANAVGGGHD